MSDMSAMSGRKQLEHNDQRHDGPERPELIAPVAAGDSLSVLAPLSIPFVAGSEGRPQRNLSVARTAASPDAQPQTSD
jgi:hypothetical protein